MDQAQTIAELESRANRVGIPLYKLAVQAGIAPSTFYRWKTGSKAGFGNVLAVQQHLDSIEKIRGLA